MADISLVYSIGQHIEFHNSYHVTVKLLFICMHCKEKNHYHVLIVYSATT